MSLERAPAVDRRTAADIERQLRERLHLHLEPGQSLVESLACVLARYGEIIIERLNRAPDKHFLVFLDGLGVAPIPPSAARVPLSFKPVQGLPQKQAVPQQTQVAAAGASVPVVFETEEPLLLSEASVARIIAVDSMTDEWADCDEPQANLSDPEDSLFEPYRPQEHVFYLAHSELLGSSALSRLRLNLEFDGGASGQEVEWFIPAPDGAHSVIPARDGTHHCTGSGEIVFEGCEDFEKWPVCDLFGHEGHWLGCRLVKRAQSHRGSPYLSSLRMSAEWDQDDAEVQQLFCNRLPLEPGGEFYPLGERPRYNDAFYLSSEAFARPGTHVVLRIQLVNPTDADRTQCPLPPVCAEGQPQLRWETWNGRFWQSVDCKDKTDALTKSADVELTLPEQIRPTELNGVQGHWLRARLRAGNYGEESRFEVDHEGRWQQTPATMAPPVIAKLTVRARVTRRGLAPQTLLIRNGLESRKGAVPVRLFQTEDAPRRAMYVGLCWPPGRKPNANWLDLYWQPEPPRGRLHSRGSEDLRRSSPRWEYWDGGRWTHCPTVDFTNALRDPGLIRLQPGQHLSWWKECALDDAKDLYWLRLLLDEADQEIQRPRRLLLNTVLARNFLTLKNELLGSSSGNPGQTFQCNRSPVLDGFALEVREPDVPAADELPALWRAHGKEAVREQRDERGRLIGAWVLWNEVPDFLHSGSVDRHFVLDRQHGRIRFGDDIHGRVPPTGSNNIRVRRYRTGGGDVGNQPVGSVSQLRSSVAHVVSVSNFEAAVGGWDREDQKSLLQRGATLLRHRRRAVTARDFEDLACMASPEVARARCYDLRDLATDPDGVKTRAGMASVVIVPRSRDAVPRPRRDLLERVQGFLTGYTSPGIGLVLLGPEYLSFEVEAELVPHPEELPADLTGICVRSLAAFLHPLYGGDKGEGWSYGKRPKRSDLFAVLESVRGVDHVRSLHIHTKEERPGLERCGLFLVCSGRHRLRLWLGN